MEKERRTNILEYTELHYSHFVSTMNGLFKDWREVSRYRIYDQEQVVNKASNNLLWALISYRI